MYQLLQTHLLNFFFRIFSAKAGTVACLFTGGTDMSSKFSSQVSVRISLQFQYIRHARRYHSVHFEDNLSSATPLWMSDFCECCLWILTQNMSKLFHKTENSHFRTKLCASVFVLVFYPSFFVSYFRPQSLVIETVSEWKKHRCVHVFRYSVLVPSPTSLLANVKRKVKKFVRTTLNHLCQGTDIPDGWEFREWDACKKKSRSEVAWFHKKSDLHAHACEVFFPRIFSRFSVENPPLDFIWLIVTDRTCTFLRFMASSFQKYSPCKWKLL